MSFHSSVFNDQIHAFPSTSQGSTSSFSTARQSSLGGDSLAGPSILAFDHASNKGTSQLPTSSMAWTDWSEFPTIAQPYSSEAFEAYPPIPFHSSMSPLQPFFSVPLWPSPLDHSYTDMAIDAQPTPTSSLACIGTPESSSFCDTPALTPSGSDSEASSTLSPPYQYSKLPELDSTSSVSTDLRSCVHCGTTSTSAWRRVPGSHDRMCNACGLYIRQRNMMRPQMLIDADTEVDTEVASYEGPECNHCHSTKTSAWRRSKEGMRLCNACGLYLVLRGKERPLSLKKNTVKPRAKRNGRAAIEHI